MVTFKSKLTKKIEIDYNKSFVLEQLYADPKMIELHAAKLKEVYKEASESFIRHQVDNIIIKENAFNTVMSYLVTCFEFEYDNEELKALKARLKQQMPNSTDDQLDDIGRKLIQKGLIFNMISSENNLVVSDDDVKKYLEQYYKSTNNSINQYLNDQSKFNEIKNIVTEEKITQWLITRFKISLTIQNILNRQVPIKEEQKQPN